MRALIALGSNLGDREANLRLALTHLESSGAARVVSRSTLIETAPVGGPPGQGPYLNGAAVIETRLAPRELLAAMQRAESAAGRTHDGPRWSARTADLDLLLVEDRVIDEPGLTVPHPRMTERRFVLAPAAEVAPEWVHPAAGRTIRALLEALPA